MWRILFLDESKYIQWHGETALFKSKAKAGLILKQICSHELTLEGRVATKSQIFNSGLRLIGGGRQRKLRGYTPMSNTSRKWRRLVRASKAKKLTYKHHKPKPWPSNYYYLETEDPLNINIFIGYVPLSNLREFYIKSLSGPARAFRVANLLKTHFILVEI